MDFIQFIKEFPKLNPTHTPFIALNPASIQDKLCEGLNEYHQRLTDAAKNYPDTDKTTVRRFAYFSFANNRTVNFVHN